jgi:hypothetical protein
MTLPRTETGEVMHPSGATRPLGVLLHLPPRREVVERLFPSADDDSPGQTVALLDAPHPDEDDALHALHFLTDLLDDPRSTLTRTQLANASGELNALLLDSARDVVHEDPECTVLDLPGRTAAAALRIILQRGLIRDEWDT